MDGGKEDGAVLKQSRHTMKTKQGAGDGVRAEPAAVIGNALIAGKRFALPESGLVPVCENVATKF